MVKMKNYKKEIKEIMLELNITYMQAQQELAQRNGFNNYKDMKNVLISNINKE